MIAPLRPDDPKAIGPYRLYGQLGSGGMGQVFLSRSAGGRPIAVKIIRAELAADPEFRMGFRREVAAARKVSGAFTAPVVDADTDGPVPWLATTYVAGPSLAEAVNSHGPLPADKVLSLAGGLAESLVAIHAAGVVHGDLKPSNVLLAEDGPRVIDFGISCAAWASATPGWSFGSPRFMSPEHALGQVMGPPSDIFSLGAVLTFAATGQGPFGSGSSAALIYRLVNSPALLDPLPAELRALVGSCLVKHPGDRPSASALLTQVHAIQQQSGCLPEPAVSTTAEDKTATEITSSETGVKTPASAAVSSEAWRSALEPLPSRPGRDLRHRVSRALPLFVPGLVAALAAGVYLMGRAVDPSAATLTQPQGGVTAPAVQAQPQAGGAVTITAPTPVVTVTAHARQRQIAAAIIQGPSASAFLSPSAFTTTLPVPSGSEPVPLGSPASSSSSGSGSASAKPSKSGSPSPTASKSGSSSPPPSSSSPPPSSSSPPPSSSSPPPSSSSPPPSSSSATPTPTGT